MLVVPAAPLDHENPDKDTLRRVGKKVRTRLAAHPAARRVEVEDAELWTLDRFLDAAECRQLAAMIDQVAQPSLVYSQHGGSGIRTSYSADLDPADPLVRRIEGRLDTLFDLKPSHGETIQGQRYTVGQEFKPHIDWFPPGTKAWDSEWTRGGQRTITAMAFLNAVEEGGETDFPLLGIAVRPRAGMLLVWNNADEHGVPNPWTFHAGKPVVRGAKYVFTKWYRTKRRR